MAVERRSHSAKIAITLGQIPSSHLFKTANYALPGYENMLPDQGRRGRNPHFPSILTQTVLAAVLPAVQNLNLDWILKNYSYLPCYASFINSYMTLHCSEFITYLPFNNILLMLLSTLDNQTFLRTISDGLKSTAKAALCSINTNCYSMIRSHVGPFAGVCLVRLKSLKKSHLCCIYCASKEFTVVLNSCSEQALI